MIRVVLEPKESRAAAYDGETRVGLCEYTRQNGVWAIMHTETSPDYGGQGIAARLVACVAEAARAAGVRIDPVCPYAAKWIEKNAPALR